MLTITRIGMIAERDVTDRHVINDLLISLNNEFGKRHSDPPVDCGFDRKLVIVIGGNTSPSSPDRLISKACRLNAISVNLIGHTLPHTIVISEMSRLGCRRVIAFRKSSTRDTDTAKMIALIRSQYPQISVMEVVTG